MKLPKDFEAPYTPPGKDGINSAWLEAIVRDCAKVAHDFPYLDIPGEVATANDFDQIEYMILARYDLK